MITGRNDQQDGYEAIIALMPWEKFCTSVAEAEALARLEEFDAYKSLGEHYAGVLRRWSPVFLDAFVFESVPASASLMRAAEVLREANRSETSSSPKSAPTGFIKQRWAASCRAAPSTGATTNSACCRNCGIGCGAGDVWVTGSRQYRSYEERFDLIGDFENSGKAVTCRSPSRRTSTRSLRPAGPCSMSE